MRVDTGAMWRFVVKNWPQIVAALGTANTFLKEHPGLQDWWRERLNDVSKRVAAVQQRRGDAARIRGMLDIIRDVAHELDASAADPSRVDAAGWTRRADDIELGVRLAESQARPERRRTLARLKTETDALLADVIDAIARVRALPEGGTPEVQEGPKRIPIRDPRSAD
jgi:hypothetical protein